MRAVRWVGRCEGGWAIRQEELACQFGVSALVNLKRRHECTCQTDKQTSVNPALNESKKINHCGREEVFCGTKKLTKLLLLNALKVTAQRVSVDLKGHRSVRLHKMAQWMRKSLNMHRNHPGIVHNTDLMHTFDQILKEHFLKFGSMKYLIY